MVYQLPLLNFTSLSVISFSWTPKFRTFICSLFSFSVSSHQVFSNFFCYFSLLLILISFLSRRSWPQTCNAYADTELVLTAVLPSYYQVNLNGSAKANWAPALCLVQYWIEEILANNVAALSRIWSKRKKRFALEDAGTQHQPRWRWWRWLPLMPRSLQFREERTSI